MPFSFLSVDSFSRFYYHLVSIKNQSYRKFMCRVDMRYQVNVKEIVSWFGLNSVSSIETGMIRKRGGKCF